MNILAAGMGWIDHTPGGLNRYFADYLHAMKTQGHTIKGIMTANGEQTTAPEYMEDVLQRQEKRGTFARTNAFRSRIKRVLLASRPDVFNPHFALYSSLVTRGLIPQNVPIVTHFHGPWAQESMIEDKGASWKQRTRYKIKKNVELLSYRRSDHFIVLSRYFHDILANDYGMDPSRIHIIPGAVDVERFHPADDRTALRQSLGLDGQQKVLFCARRLVNRMGIDRLIRAMVSVAAERPDIVLYIAGDGAMRQTLDQLIQDLGLRQHVFLLGRVSNEDLVRWYQAADFSVVPTVTLEGFGLVTVEALACGTPVLGTPYGGTKEILEAFSEDLLFHDSSPEAMAEKIIQVLNGGCPVPDREHCREHVLQHYTWEKVAASVTDVFRQAIEERKGGGRR